MHLYSISPPLYVFIIHPTRSRNLNYAHPQISNMSPFIVGPLTYKTWEDLRCRAQALGLQGLVLKFQDFGSGILGLGSRG